MHYSEAVKRIWKSFKVQRRLFENECHILLLFVLDGDKVRLMKHDSNHGGWGDDAVDAQLRDEIGESYECCLEVIQDIYKAVVDM